MKLYLLSIDYRGYDTYDSCVVAAKNEEEARTIHPAEDPTYPDWNPWKQSSGWATSPQEVTVELIGTATRGTKKGVILASFNAG